MQSKKNYQYQAPPSNKELAPCAALVLICDKTRAEKIVSKFQPNLEVAAVYAIPLLCRPDDTFGDFLKRAISCIDCKFINSQVPVAQFGMALDFQLHISKFLHKCWPQIQVNCKQNEDHLVTVFHANVSHKHGYLNIGFAGGLGVGKIDPEDEGKNDRAKAFRAAVREAKEESGTDIRELDEHLFKELEQIHVHGDDKDQSNGLNGIYHKITANMIVERYKKWLEVPLTVHIFMVHIQENLEQQFLEKLALKE